MDAEGVGVTVPTGVLEVGVAVGEDEGVGVPPCAVERAVGDGDGGTSVGAG